MKFINRTGLQLHARMIGPGMEITPGKGLIEGMYPLPPGKIVEIPDDVVELTLRTREQIGPDAQPGSEASKKTNMEDNWSGRWLPDAPPEDPL